MTREELGATLAAVNAGLNSLSAICLLLGRAAAKRRLFDLHKKAMLSACLVSAVFLATYLTRVLLTGTHKYPGTGLLKAIYLLVLSTHMVLAMAVPVLALRAVFLGWRGRHAEHKRLVTWAWPLWMYVSITGVIVYLMLY